MCLPTTYEGFAGAIAWCAGQRIFDGIEAGNFGDGKPKAYIPKTTEEAIQRIRERRKK